eukprot:TRINITY_DN56111_c0_g1_i1.p1 TRINITY_DN56111_c0_g1~~TRINITY_DN56111_c0_g1_i1.p1  ORF type:complete len:478 (-),score=102.52 TRINITY_DN56111_c0_g1_i1:342-1775(-)
MSDPKQTSVVKADSTVGHDGRYLIVEDPKTGRKTQIPVSEKGVVAASALAKLGLTVYDPGYTLTAACKSSICYIDGDRGILSYRGIPIEVLAERASFMEVSYLLLMGDLPSLGQLSSWQRLIRDHSILHVDILNLIRSFRYDAHPMGIVTSVAGALGTFFPETNPALAGEGVFDDPGLCFKTIARLIGKMPTICAAAYRHRCGRPYVAPNPDLGYVANFLYMLDALEPGYTPHPVLVRALETLFILHADHELNCSTAAMRHITSAGADPYTGVAAATGALYGPKHGGANEAVLRMLERIGSVDKVGAFVERVKAKKELLFGFGHRVYKAYDPRAKIVKTVAHRVFDLMGRVPLIDVALALEDVALRDPYFIERKLYPNVDFYSGLIYQSMGFPTDFFPVLFALPRTAGWVAHWAEQLRDKEQKISRPRQVYTGRESAPYTPADGRNLSSTRIPPVSYGGMSTRRNAAFQRDGLVPKM